MDDKEREEKDKQRAWEEIKFLKTMIIGGLFMIICLLILEYSIFKEKLGLPTPISIGLTALSIPIAILLHAI